MAMMLAGFGRAIGHVGRGVLDLVLPPRCLACGTEVDAPGSLCGECWGRLVFLVPPWCRCCGLPLPSVHPEAPLCGRCAVQPPLWDHARAALRYDEGCRRMVLGFKYRDRGDVAPVFARWMIAAAGDLLAEADLLAAVPLHRRRLWLRGYNQAVLLARPIARATGVRLIPDLLLRVRATRPQQGLSGAARLANVTAGAFRLHPRHAAEVAGRHVVLIDDVLTTGATVEACTRLLKRGGAERVDIVTLARVTRDLGRAIS